MLQANFIYPTKGTNGKKTRKVSFKMRIKKGHFKCIEPKGKK